MHIPFCLTGESLHGKTIVSYEGPFCNGVFHSVDTGATWELEKISDFESWLPSLCKTKGFYYYFGAKNYQRDLWFSRKPAGGGSWQTPQVVADQFCDSALFWKYVAVADNTTVHLCWLDRRHEKRRLNLMASKRHNYEIAYSNRKDADAGWSKDILLSKGLLYSYSPSMSVEGNKIVVVWAGAETRKDWHTEGTPNDIYYVTSKNGGKTWSKILKVTDSAKEGVVSGKPQVALLNGVIHLFYIQGRMNLQQESPGLTKLNQPPWPIYYTHRPFPN